MNRYAASRLATREGMLGLGMDRPEPLGMAEEVVHSATRIRAR